MPTEYWTCAFCGQTQVHITYGEAQAHEEIDKLANRIVDLAQERAELVRALEPFAALWHDSFARREGGDSAPVWGFNDATITVGDVRRVRALLERIGGKKEQQDA